MVSELITEFKVLGIGSPFGDDQLGWKAVDLLQKQKDLQPFLLNRISFDCCDRPGPALLDYMTGSRTVFLIDAVKSNSKLGTIHRFTENEIETNCQTFSSHGFGLAEAIQLGRVLNALPQHLIFYGIEVGDLTSDDLTNTIEHALTQLVDKMTHELLTLL